MRLIPPNGETAYEVKEFEIFRYEGTGVMEDRYRNETVVKTLKCCQLDAFIISQSMNIKKYGPVHTWSSWESPKFSYREKLSRQDIILNKAI